MLPGKVKGDNGSQPGGDGYFFLVPGSIAVPVRVDLGFFSFLSSASFVVEVFLADLAVDFSFELVSSAISTSSSSFSSSGSDNLTSILWSFRIANHRTIFLRSLLYTLSKSRSGYTFSKYFFTAAASFSSGNFT